MFLEIDDDSVVFDEEFSVDGVGLSEGELLLLSPNLRSDELSTSFIAPGLEPEGELGSSGKPL